MKIKNWLSQHQFYNARDLGDYRLLIWRQYSFSSRLLSHDKIPVSVFRKKRNTVKNAKSQKLSLLSTVSEENTPRSMGGYAGGETMTGD